MKTSERIYRYPGIKPFTRDQENIFFGREEDGKKLLALILLEKLTVLFAKSGYGKSSLLNACIAPALERENKGKRPRYIPVFIRFNVWEAERGANRNWFDRFLTHFDNKVPIQNLELYQKFDFLPKTLWGEIKRRHPGNNVIYVFIFDQFEEFFSFPQEQKTQFEQQIAELLYADIPSFLDQWEGELASADANILYKKIEAKVVFSIRSDRLGELHRMKNSLPAILHKRYELTALLPEQAREAIEKPAKLSGNFSTPPYTFTPSFFEFLILELAFDASGYMTGVEAFQLQIIAQNIENRVLNGQVNGLSEEGKPLVQREDLPPLDNIYSQYYQSKIEELPPEKQLLARRVVEEGMLFEDQEGNARRVPQDGDLLKQNHGADQELLNALENSFLLRKEANAMGGYNYELSHDQLIKPILEERRNRKILEEKLEEDKRRELERRDNEKRQRVWFRTIIIAGLMIAALGSSLLWAVRQGNIAKKALTSRDMAEYSRLQLVFKEVYNRAERALDGGESDIAKGDLVQLDTILGKIKELSIPVDTLELVKKRNSIKTKIE